MKLRLIRQVKELSSIAIYCTKLKKLWDMVVFENFTFSCGFTQTMQKFEEEHKLTVFLMGLNNQYTNIRENILMMKHLPIA